MRPFCHLMIKATRVDSPPCHLTIAHLLKQYRNKLSLSQMQLAQNLGVSRKTLQNWENGRTNPSKCFWHSIRALLAKQSEPC
jgi:DNA-binding XRE family transcriptional regulator